MGEPRLWPQIRNEALSFACFLAAVALPPTLLAVYLIAVFGVTPDRTQQLDFALIAGGHTLLWGALLAWRTAWVRSIFARGTLVAGLLEPTGFEAEASARFVYSYDWQGQRIRRSVWVVQTERTERMAAASSVRVVVDPAQPRRACLRDLYVAGAPGR